MAACLAVCLAILIGSQGTVHAHSPGTHQRITELAWAYLKTYGLCKTIKILNQDEIEAFKTQCMVDLEDELLGPPPRSEYSCACVEQKCAEPCEEFWGFEKFRCVRNCMIYGPPFEEPGPPCDPPCPRPYYYTKAILNEVIDAECSRRTNENAAFSLSTRCDAYTELINDGVLTPERADEVVAFYQNFVSTPCPFQSYNYYSNDENCISSQLCKNSGPLFKARRVAILGPKLVVGPDAPDSSDTPNLVDTFYLPIVGGPDSLLFMTNGTTSDPTTPPDLTGTIIGLHVGITDNITEIITGLKIAPAITDSFQIMSEVSIGAPLSSFAAAALVSGATFCALACVFVPEMNCKDCWKGLWDKVKDILEGLDAAEDKINGLYVPAAHGVKTFGNDNTGMLHMMSPLGLFDDVDGLNMQMAVGSLVLLSSPMGAFFSADWLAPAGGPVGFFFFGFDPIDYRVDWGKSKRALTNYQTKNSDDPAAYTDSSFRNRHYWERLSMLLYIFPPADNLSYYFWHKWLQGRWDNTVVERYGLMPLGAAIHAVQDLTSIHHSVGKILNGHSEDEADLNRRLDLSAVLLQKDPAWPIIIDLHDTDAEKLFLERVSMYLHYLHDEVLAPYGGILHIRVLAHAVRKLIWHVGYEHFYDGFWNKSMTTDEDRRAYIVPIAVAATVLILTEGATTYLYGYNNALNLDLEDFEWVGPFPDDKTMMPAVKKELPASRVVDGTSLPANYVAEYPEWACTTQRPRAEAAIRAFFKDQVTAEEASKIVMGEKLACELDAAGLPVPPDEELDRQGKFQIDIMQAYTDWLVHGSAAQLDQDLACVLARLDDLYPPAQFNALRQRCYGILDSDGDGVYDQDDHCLTSNVLLEEGYTVQPDGCVFKHEPVIEPDVPEIIPGAMTEVAK